MSTGINFGGTGHSLGYYHDIVNSLIWAPIAILLITAVVFNVLVGFATWWIMKAWKDPHLLPDSNIWEDIFALNLKVARYLLGSCIELKENKLCNEEKKKPVLSIQDHYVSVPLAMVFIQLSQIALAMILFVLFVDFLVVQVTHFCDPAHRGVDCFDANEKDMNAMPLSCNGSDGLNDTICFHLSFNPIIGVAMVGGFLIIVPYWVFAAIVYIYFKILKVTDQCTRSKAGQVIVAVIVEIGYIVAGIIFLTIDSVQGIFDSPNPVRRLTVIFTFVMYFLMAGFVWCLVPDPKHSVRLQNFKMKKGIQLSTLPEKN